jgi:hypothetical protein
LPIPQALMPLYVAHKQGRRDVRCWANRGKDVLGLSISDFDPTRTLATRRDFSRLAGTKECNLPAALLGRRSGDDEVAEIGSLVLGAFRPEDEHRFELTAKHLLIDHDNTSPFASTPQLTWRSIGPGSQCLIPRTTALTDALTPINLRDTRQRPPCVVLWAWSPRRSAPLRLWPAAELRTAGPNVRSQSRSGNHLLPLSFTAFDLVDGARFRHRGVP